MYCPFCRRALAQMASTSDHLKSLGVESLAIVGTELDNARLYFKFRPTRMALGADPQLTHPPLVRRAAAGADAGVDADGRTALTSTRPASCRRRCRCPPPAAALTALDGYQNTPTDQRDFESTFTQMKGQFLIDRDGIVRWAHIECGKEGLAGMGKFPSHDELIGAASLVIGEAKADK